MPKIAQIIRDTALGRDYIAVDRNGGLWSGEIETAARGAGAPSRARRAC
jgi:hypothetical protein